MLPDAQDLPASAAQASMISCIPNAIPLDLPVPLFRQLEPPRGKSPAMPEVAIHKNRDSQVSEHEVGPPREIAGVKLGPQAQCGQHAGDSTLWPRVLPANPRHHGASCLRRHEIPAMLSAWLAKRIKPG